MMSNPSIRQASRLHVVEVHLPLHYQLHKQWEENGWHTAPAAYHPPTQSQLSIITNQLMNRLWELWMILHLHGWKIGLGCKHSKVDQENAPVYESHDFLGQMPISSRKMLFRRYNFFMMTTIVKLGTQIQNINMRFAVEFESNSSLSRRWCTFPPIERLGCRDCRVH